MHEMTTVADYGSRSLTGAWIETLNYIRTYGRGLSRSLTGAWIETTNHLTYKCLSLSLPYGGVD